jgi:hypothetical protein
LAIPGRKRKPGHREPNGRIRRMDDHARDALNVEKLTVLAQPHRRGEREDQKQASPLGRFVMRHKLREELYDAGNEYAGMVRCFYAARLPAGALTGIPQLPGDDRGSGNGVSPQKAAWLGKELSRLETPLKAFSRRGFSALRMLAVHEREIGVNSEGITAKVLYLLAVMLKRVGGRK